VQPPRRAASGADRVQAWQAQRMSKTSIGLSDELQAYVVEHTTEQDELLADLARETQSTFAQRFGMQIAPEQGRFMTLLTQLLGARFAVEVGTFTGYSSICIARGLADGGSLLCCDVSEEWTSVARRYWERAGLADRVELRIAPALETLRSLPQEPHVDIAFIDADKTGYSGYWEELVPRMRSGGVILCDNVLQDGNVVDSSATDESTVAIRAFNDHVVKDPRVEVVLLPIADGLTMARKL
jgi:caffeoyl-CoA O-methyltransferase